MNNISKEEVPAQRIDYETALIMSQEEIKRLLKGAPSVIRGQTGHLSRAGGKAIRARALLTCAAREDGLIDTDAVKAAAAIELLHLATLVHDDVIDNAAKRRGVDTLQKKFGPKIAVLCGDYLFCVAFQLASAIREPEKRPDGIEKALPRYLSDICLGELRQNQNNFNFRLTEREYFKIISGKTAALFEACFYAGFLFSGEPEGLKEKYTDIGRNIGIIFQLSDDCADYESTRKESKKPVLSDFRQGVITLPLIYALKTDGSLRGRIEGGISPPELKKAVTRAGGLEYTHSKIERLFFKTSGIIAALDTSAEKKERLYLLLGKSAGMPVPSAFI